MLKYTYLNLDCSPLDCPLERLVPRVDDNIELLIVLRVVGVFHNPGLIDRRCVTGEGELPSYVSVYVFWILKLIVNELQNNYIRK